jgi:hypothetical protein
MLAPAALEPIAVAAQTVHRIEDGRGLMISCIRGPTWVTQEGDPRDIVLASGESVVLDRRGVAVVYAFQDALITVGAPQLSAAGHRRATLHAEPACA